MKSRANNQSERLAAVLLIGLSLATAGCRNNPAPVPTVPPPLITSGTITSIPEVEPASWPEETPTPPPTTATPLASGPVAANLIQEYINASYRVVAVVRNPFAPYAVIVATERSRSVCGSPEEPVRCRIDDTCGASTTSPVCFFFIEPGFDGASDPATQYVARWPDASTDHTLMTESLRFINARTIEFTTRSVESDQEDEQVWWLDLVTGAAAQLDRLEP
ncbi:MAG: hypothetical protein R6X18_08110 [Chloroflexota bacterium]